MANKVFTVTGTGPFPYDMLRYDSCWPATSEDAAKLNCPYHEREQDKSSRRTIMLHTNSEFSPNYRRWESFAWKVNIS